jgi:hypothetical protein
MFHAVQSLAALPVPLPSVGGNLAASLTSSLSTIGNSIIALLQSLFN